MGTLILKLSEIDVYSSAIERSDSRVEIEKVDRELERSRG